MSESHSTEIEYRQVVGHPRHRVGSDASVWVYKRKRQQWVMLTPFLDKGGYPMVTLCQGGKQGNHHVHTIVLEAFVGPCPPGMEACHDPDRTRTNCLPSNLRWDTRKANHADKRKHGTAFLKLCRKGHEMTPENCVTRKDNEARNCRICANARAYRRRHAKMLSVHTPSGGAEASDGNG